ncbi:MAG TPA: S41 family peptidase [Bacteroidetes bacterium]|nr:S41 family peptidase [Bacteroidota bacterium]HRR09618.1 S41 family peptidase [Rhodothermales bacterium]
MKYLRVWLVLIPTCALLFVGFRNDDLFFQLKKNFTIFGKIYEELATGYVDPVDPEKLLRKGVNEMMRSLDPYTVFFDEADNEDAELQMRGGLGTVGAAIGMREGKVTVVELLEGYSAAEQGIRVGDAIIHINGKPTVGQTIREIASLLNGEPGSALTVGIERQGETELLSFSLLRKKLELKNVTHAGFVADDTTRGIGYIKLAQFGRDCAREVKEAVLSLKNTNKLKGLVLDLRGNPGGLLDQAIMITSLFVPEGSPIVSTKGRLATSEQLVKSAVPPILPNTPLTILLDRTSASASEVVSGAIQDLDRGVIIGETSFGKGLVQAVKPLVYNTSMKFTSAKYYTPSGRCIQALNYSDVDEDGEPVAVPDSLRKSFKTKAGRMVKDGKGIDPDLPVKMGTTTELEQALQRRSAFLFFANQFAANRPTIAANFDVTDGLLNEFRQWLNSQNFSYKTKSEKSLEKLQAELTKAGYTRSSSQAQSLLNQINREKNDDFTRNAPRLKLLLRLAILARYYGPVAQIKAQMVNDPFLSEAEKVIRDTKRYAQILGQKS